jgi:hypothetical protein
MAIGDDDATGFPPGTILTPFQADPPQRVAPLTPFQTEANSEDIWKPPVCPNQALPATSIVYGSAP